MTLTVRISRRTALMGVASMALMAALPAAASPEVPQLQPLRLIGPLRPHEINAEMRLHGFGREALRNLYDGDLQMTDPRAIVSISVSRYEWAVWHVCLGGPVTGEWQDVDLLSWLNNTGSVHFENAQPQSSGWYYEA